MVKFKIIFLSILIIIFNSCSKETLKKSVINEKSLELQVLEAYEEGVKALEGGDVLFAATGVTDGSMLDGVKNRKKHISTHSLVMRAKTGTVRRIHAEHEIDKALSGIAQL